MSAEIKYTAICRNNQLLIFDGLSAAEKQTGRWLYEDVSDFANSIGRYNYCTRYLVKSKVMLVALLKEIENECRAGVLFPALHFECHGDPEKGLWLASSNEHISWHDLAQLVAPINSAARNNVSLILATCHGFVIREAVNLKAPCPFHFMIAPSQEVSAGVVYDSFVPFYKEMISTGELNAAILHLNERFERFIAGEWFYTAIARFYINSYSYKDKQEIINLIIDDEVAKAGYRNHELVRAARAKAKKVVSSPRQFYMELEKAFLHGRSMVSYEDIKKFIDHHKKSKGN
ncbi:hypothetical protein OO258_16480 [Pseudomonas sp. DCB_BI]|uniref:hypothetical protein n=1 Tax=Pseudomonas sp. DCB_BI TaxID=2993594 RepID=UPI00224B69C6|nr:hypothetical protein [Pseudomonas sp. DCB_BI]MCX2889837.1 hypothetical protein [Pseudomonas sp. DCB_BI]